MCRFLALMTLAALIRANAISPEDPVTYKGLSDASAAVALDRDMFAVADDEDNILRFYRLSAPGKPVFDYNLNPHIRGKKKSREADIEGATRLGKRIFWITSHGRDNAGKAAPDRHRLFALEIRQDGGDIIVQTVGRIYTNLLADMGREPRLERFRLMDAAGKPPKAPGGLNIEALGATAEGALLIGFRSPVPEGRALIVPLLNPNELLGGDPPRFGDPILLDLGGGGLRDMGSTGSGHYLIAGPGAEGGKSHLYFWAGGSDIPVRVPEVTFKGATPEAVCFQDIDGQADLVVLSDDGNRVINGKRGKDLPRSERQFRAFRITR